MNSKVRRLRHFSMKRIREESRFFNIMGEQRECIFVVDDEQQYRDGLSTLLSKYEVVTSSTAEEAISNLQHRVPNLFLLDVTMPGMDGLELLEHLRSDAKTKTIPIILVSAISEPENMVRAFELGANDYVTKPFNVPVLLARVEAHLREAALKARLETQNSILSKLAAFDDLTGIYNRRSMMDALEAEVTRSVRYSHALAVVAMDLDHFKSVNDTHGHNTGDVVLCEFAQRVMSTLRTSDVFCRHGGEEFCIIMPETDQPQASHAAERIRALIEGEPFVASDNKIPLTVSVGLACLPEKFDGTPEQLLKEADQALYEAKRSGRNMVRIYNHENCQVGD